MCFDLILCIPPPSNQTSNIMRLQMESRFLSDKGGRVDARVVDKENNFLFSTREKKEKIQLKFTKRLK